MSENGTYHGWYTPGEYKRAEKEYWFYSDLLSKWGLVTISFAWPDQEKNQWVNVKGRVSRVFRDNCVPYIEFPYLEYDEARSALIQSLKKPKIEKPADIHELFNGINDSFVDVDMQTELGLIPEGIYTDKTVQINLSCDLLRVDVLDLTNPVVPEPV